MNISRFLTEDLIRIEMETVIQPPGENNNIDKWRQGAKEIILSELVDLLEDGHRVGNRTKLLLDFVNREKKATTGLSDGVAVPHIRSLQAKEFMMAIGRSTPGYDFGSLDGKPTHLFFTMAAPPYDDSLYLRVFKALAGMLQYESFRKELLDASSPGEVIRAIRSME